MPVLHTELEEAQGALTARREARASSTGARREPVVALVDWSQLVEDFLDNIGVTFAAFCDEMSGGWMFGYIDALKQAGVRTVLFCVSARVREPQRVRHAATGATICVLPAPRVYRALRRRMLNPYAATVEAAVGDVRGARRACWRALRQLSPYLATPLIHLTRALRDENCAAVLCQDYEHARLDVCLLAGRLARLPVFATFQGGTEPLTRLEARLRPHALRACDGLVVATRTESERVRALYGLPPSKIARIFNPLDVREWGRASAHEGAEARATVGIPAGARVAVWHGRVDYRRKGLDVLLEAWQRVCRERAGRELRLLLVGTGNDAAELRARLAETKPAGVVWIDKYSNDRALLRRYLHAADVYAFPSRHEGFPVAPLEAMACGLPLVAADAPGIPDILEGGETQGGLMVARGDAGAFASALGRLLDDDALSQRLGALARRRVEDDFSPSAVGANLRAFMSRRAPALAQA
jgi:starch synthase